MLQSHSQFWNLSPYSYDWNRNQKFSVSLLERLACLVYGPLAQWHHSSLTYVLMSIPNPSSVNCRRWECCRDAAVWNSGEFDRAEAIWLVKTTIRWWTNLQQTVEWVTECQLSSKWCFHQPEKVSARLNPPTPRTCCCPIPEILCHPTLYLWTVHESMH